MLTALYTRVSTEQQVDKDSLATQRAQLKAYCDARGIKNWRLYEETGKSAKDTNRPKLRELLQDIGAGKVGAVVVTRLDRITRSIVDLWQIIRQFREHNVEFVSLAERIETEGPAGRFLANILGSLAQFEREIIAKRVAESMHYRASLGKWNGGPVPFGYTTQGRICKELLTEGKSKEAAAKIASRLAPEPKRLYPDEKEARTVRKTFETYLEARSIRETARRLNTAGCRTRSGAHWSTTTVSRILASSTYVGKACYGKRKTDLDTGKVRKADRGNWQIVEGAHKGLIPQSLFEAVQETLATTSQKPKRRSRGYPLSGLLRCGKCGRPMYGYTYNKPNGATYSYYKCARKRTYEDRKECEGLSVPAEGLENFAVETLKRLSADQAFLADKAKMLGALREEVESIAGNGNEEFNRLRKEHADLETRRENLLSSLERGVIDDSLFRERYDKVMNLLEENRLAQTRCRDTLADRQAARECLQASFDEIASFGRNWDILDAEGRSALLRTIVKQINVTEKDLKLQIYLDHPPNSVEASSRTGTGSGPRPA